MKNIEKNKDQLVEELQESREKIAEIVFQHQEKIDGSGYPRGLKGDEILIEAKILGVANVVEAMSSSRSYRPAISIEESLAEISKKKNILFDLEVVDTCLKLFKEKGFKFRGKIKRKGVIQGAAS